MTQDRVEKELPPSMKDLQRTGPARGLRGIAWEARRELARLGELEALKEERGVFEELVQDLEHQERRWSEAAVITLVGATGAGKSTLLNALVGASVAVEGETRPTTSEPVIYRPQDAELGSLLEGLPGGPARVVDYDPAASGPWRGQILIDAPDVNSVNAEHREVVRSLAERSDVLLVVAHRQSVSELASVAFVDSFAERRCLLVVLNRCDELSTGAQEELRQELERIVQERWRAPDTPVILTSARAARSQPAVPGWAELCSRLQSLVERSALGRVRRHNALGSAARISALAERIQRQVEPRFAELERTVEEGFRSWREFASREMNESFALRRTALRELIWSEASRRWPGPVGWALRAGSASGLAFGAGALLVRRNPVLAAGTAATGAALGKARSVLRERQILDATGLLPGSGTLQACYRKGFARARLLNAELTGVPDAHGLPSAEELETELGSTAGESWERLCERELPRAAERGARWWLRWPLDLPVYAFAGWVVVQAALGFTRGEYLGLDYLVNALLLLLVWLFLARALARAFFGRRAAAILTSTRRDLDRRIEDSILPFRERMDTALQLRRRALKNLATLAERWRARLDA